MATRYRWIAGGLLVGVAVIAGAWLVHSGSSHERAARAQVVDIADGNNPLRGDPVDLVAVGSSYVGLVDTKSAIRFVTSADGLEWQTVVPTGLPDAPIMPMTLPGGLNNVDHTLFSDGDALYLRTVSRSEVNNVGTVALYVSDAHARAWRPVVLPAPAGEYPLPIAAAMAPGRRYLAGSVSRAAYGSGYLDAAVWISDHGGPWRLVDAPALSGRGNQTIFALDVVGRTVLAGGGDGALLDNSQCCFYPYGAAFWRSTDGGVHWSRSTATQPPYEYRDAATVVGFVTDGAILRADIVGYPMRSAESRDLGATWTLSAHETAPGGVTFPRASRILRVDDRELATTTPNIQDVCDDCTAGVIAATTDGTRWRDIPARFPCGTQLRTNYGFVSAPVAIGSSIVALGGCGAELAPFDRTLLAISADHGAHWQITAFTGPTGGPLPAVARADRIVTLVADGTQSENQRIRAVVVRPNGKSAIRFAL